MTLLARILLALTLGAVPAPPPPPAAVPTFTATGKGAEPDGSARVRHEGFSMRVREIAGTERAELLWKLVAASTDPLAGSTEAGPTFRTFLLEVDNAGATPAQFNPGFFQLRFGEERRSSLGYTQVYRRLIAAAGSEEEAARVEPLLSESSVPVPPGARIVRLLAFERVPGRTRGCTLEMPEVRVGDKDLALRFRFERTRPAR